MKYLTDELWCGINSESAKEREVASSKWEENLEKYSMIFEEIKKYYQKNF